jgi:hypothetical protein
MKFVIFGGLKIYLTLIYIYIYMSNYGFSSYKKNSKSIGSLNNNFFTIFYFSFNSTHV